MFGSFKRILAMGLGSALLAGCAVIPDAGSPRPETSGPVTSAPPAAPDMTALPQDEDRHRVALLVPMSGENAEVGQSIANATTMALLDTGAENLRITTYDTSGGAASAARRAVADGNRLILGPLQRDNVGDVLSVARANNVPLITFSNDTTVARNDVFVMGHVPEQSVERTVDFAMDQGASRFAILAPRGDYGNRTTVAAERAVQARGGTIVDVQRYDRGNTSIISAADRLATTGGYDTVLIADNARLAAMAAPRLKDAGDSLPSLIGTELWSRQGSLLNSAEMRGAWFAAVPDDRYRQFASSYESRFGQQPFRIATLGYDAVLLTLRLTRDWRPGRDLPEGLLTDDGGFLGLDGPIRFQSNGIGERAMEVRQVGNGAFTVVSPAPTGF
ncbi:penicillin-binding protein activator [Aurantiacibacter gangjinensis]|uniref:ABC transporter substrate-binding protein n=1 Tax=Aurantiacibacter gangjinensis TaxID=502682 RepID=A0A0G9MQA8_9SPHN|nr:penicillin-binding protein activator [Aurantiacibacter gangjinensis]APE28738.1 ABC-type branched-chain amino acid transport systems, periplasmic component [Aurantiacibacter gangjinensis]KLE32895.1 ABC transporter substrate-binding protein [Aurantiacibacter gangjinensis]